MKGKFCLIAVLVVFALLTAGCTLSPGKPPEEKPGETPSLLTPPSSVTAEVKGSTARITWSKSTETGVKGYNVFRSLLKGKNYMKLTEEPLDVNEFTDKELAEGLTYYYAVTVVNSQGTDSEFSQEASALVLGIELIIDKNNSIYAGLCEEKESQFKKDLCLSNYAIEHLDGLVCNFIEGLSKDNCFNEVATKKNEAAFCAFITVLNPSMKDACYKTIAVALNDAKICLQIKDKTVSDECTKTIALSQSSATECNSIAGVTERDDCFTQLAQKLKDYKVCNNISSSRSFTAFKKDECLNSLLSSATDEKICALYIDKTLADNCYNSIAVNTGNFDLCEKIVSDYNSDVCVFNVDKNVLKLEYCTIIKDANIQQDCFTYLGEKNPSIEACELILNFPDKETCYYNLAVKNLSFEQCKNIAADMNKRDSCYSQIAADLNQSSACIRIRDNTIRNNCYALVALNSLSPEVCEKITTGTGYISCISEIAIKLKDYSVCKQVTKDYPAFIYNRTDYCYYDFGVELKSHDACAKIFNPAYRVACDGNASI
ncbi:MAG: fibronectin type III domain-containing protein [Candidatus Diapherotrites archaeon]